MKKILDNIKLYLERGFASTEEKEALVEAVSSLKDDEKEGLASDLAKVKDLPLEHPNEDEEIENGIKLLFEKHAKAIEDSLKLKMDEYMEQHVKLASEKVGVYHPAVQKQRNELNTRFRELAAVALEGDNAKLKEMTTDGTGSPYAGYTIDTELSAEIRHLITEYGVARREMTVLPLSKGDYKANNLATDVTVYWVDEAGAIASTQAVLGQGTLSLKKLATIVTLTAELLQETEIDFIAFLGGRVAEGFAQAEDEAFFKGDGTSSYGSFTGLLEAGDVNEVTMTGSTFTSLDADDLLDMVDQTPSGALVGAKFYIHRTNMSTIRKLKDSQGAYIYQAPSDGGPQTVWGYPVVLVEAMPAKTDTAAETSFVLFGNLRRACLLGIGAEGLRVNRFDSGTVRNVANSADLNLITTDREAVRWVERTGYLRIIPTAVTKLTTAAASA